MFNYQPSLLTKLNSEQTTIVCLVLCILTGLSFACVHLFSSSHFGTKHPPLDEICNLIDRTNTDTEGNDCNTDEPNELRQVLQQLFCFFTLFCY
jgi:hypothetical protein